MSLDDRSLREHLDRRADAGHTNTDDLAEAVIAGLPSSRPMSWWQSVGRGGRALALVATVAVALIFVTQAVAPRLGGGPGTSASASPQDSSPAPSIAATPLPRPTDRGGQPSLNLVAFSTNAVDLTGFETADVEVTATLPADVAEFGQMDGSLTPLVCLEKAGPVDPLGTHDSTIARTMVRTAGTTQWVASFRLTAGDSGRWRVSCLIAYDEAGHELSMNPAMDINASVLDVAGAHAPLLTMEFDPSPAVIGKPLEVFGHVTDEDTGDPYGGVVVTIGRDNVCAEGGAGDTVTTNPNGAYTFLIPEADSFPVCTWITDLDGILPGVSAQDPIAVYEMLFAHPTEP